MTAPTIVCICGSTKYKKFILGHSQRETLQGKIVINHGFFHHEDLFPITDETKDMLDELMLRKIDVANEILVVNPNGYIGNSTKRAIAYATEQCLPVRYTSKEEEERRARDKERVARRS
jgi:hypothetical protein